MGFAPGLPALFRGSFQPLQGSGESVSLDLPAPQQQGRLSLRQYTVGSVASHTYDAAANGHECGEGEVFPDNPDPNATDSWTWPPCTASFTNDTLPGSLLVCLGILNADFTGGLSPNVNLFIDAGKDSWGPPGGANSIFNKSALCATIAGAFTQVPWANAELVYQANAPVVAAGRLFYGGLLVGSYCNNFAYQMILAEFASDGATLDSFSYNTTSPELSPGNPLSLTGRLPSDNPSFVISVTSNNPGNGAAAGSGFTLGPASSLGSQWQWQQFAAQPTGYASPQWPSGCPGLSGSFELGFNGVAASFTQVGAFVWNLHPPAAPSGEIFQPNVCIVT